MIDAVGLHSICIAALRVIFREIIVVYIPFCLSLNSEIVKMSALSTVSIPLILIKESSKRVVFFMIKLMRGQALSPAFTNSGIITGLFNEHMTIELMVIQNLNEKITLLVITESKGIKNMYYIVIHQDVVGSQCKYWMQQCHTQGVSMGDQLCWVGRKEIMSVEGTSMQLHRQIPELQHDNYCPCVASQVVGKVPKFSIFSGDSTIKGEISFEQQAFGVKSVMQSHTEATLREE